MNPDIKNKTVLKGPFQSFFNKEAGSGILLIAFTIVALIWANSPLAEYYYQLWKTYFIVGFGQFSINKPLLLWINDGLMAIFFFVVGLEIKRELLDGELSSPRKASLPLAAAVGGAVLPALIYFGLNVGTSEVSGWGVPMATDIAFAIGVLALMGKRAPLVLKVFVTALAIVDDLIAVLVIAIFYTDSISFLSLGIGLGLLSLAFLANRLRINNTTVYTIIGIAVWVAFLKSGVHATIAGVLVALAVPIRTKIKTSDFVAQSGALLDAIRADGLENKKPTSRQRNAIFDLEVASSHVLSPLKRMEHGLHGFMAFGIMPVFALANAGVAFSADIIGGLLGSAVFWGIFLGLLVGKPIGVFALAWVAIKSGIAEMPRGISWMQLLGAGALAGIGFTMALFIANLAFDETVTLETAKLAILAASLASGILGWFLLTGVSSPEQKDETSDMPESLDAAVPENV